MIEKIKKIIVPVIFFIFFLIVLLQQSFVFLYHDDYGYASLSYGYYMEGINGTNFTFIQLIKFLTGHYMVWGGRILTFFYEICLISKNLWAYRIIQSIVITLIFYFIYKISRKIINKSVPSWLIAITVVLCYGIFEVFMFRTGIFWISASVSYVTPLLPLFVFIYYYQDSKTKKFKNNFEEALFYIGMGFCIFLASFSQEQIGLAAFSYVLSVGIYNSVISKKIDKKDAIMFSISLIGFLILMLAPGNEIRKSHPTSIGFYSLPLLKRIMQGTKNLILGNFSPSYTRMFTMLFYFTTLYYAVKCVTEKRGIRWISICSMVSTLLIIIASLAKQEWYFDFLLSLANGNEIIITMFLILFVLQIMLIFYSIIIYFIGCMKLKLVNITICIILSQGCMIIAPYFDIRSALVFNFFFFILFVYALFDIYDNIKEKWLVYSFIIVFAIISLYNISKITYGYYQNNATNIENDRILKKAAFQIKNGETMEKIKLYKLPQIIYAGEQAYIPGNEYIYVYMKEYYDLPKDIEIYYE